MQYTVVVNGGSHGTSAADRFARDFHNGGTRIIIPSPDGLEPVVVRRPGSDLVSRCDRIAQTNVRNAVLHTSAPAQRIHYQVAHATLWVPRQLFHHCVTPTVISLSVDDDTSVWKLYSPCPPLNLDQPLPPQLALLTGAGCLYKREVGRAVGSQFHVTVTHGAGEGAALNAFLNPWIIEAALGSFPGADDRLAAIANGAVVDVYLGASAETLARFLVYRTLAQRWRQASNAEGPLPRRLFAGAGSPIEQARALIVAERVVDRTVFDGSADGPESLRCERVGKTPAFLLDDYFVKSALKLLSVAGIEGSAGDVVRIGGNGLLTRPSPVTAGEIEDLLDGGDVQTARALDAFRGRVGPPDGLAIILPPAPDTLPVHEREHWEDERRTARLFPADVPGAIDLWVDLLSPAKERRGEDDLFAVPAMVDPADLRWLRHYFVSLCRRAAPLPWRASEPTRLGQGRLGATLVLGGGRITATRFPAQAGIGEIRM